VANDGARDVARAAAELAARLPVRLAPFAWLAFNYRWSWTPGGRELFAAIDPHRFDACGENPVRLLREASLPSLLRAAEDDALVERAGAALRDLEADLVRPYRGARAGASRVAFLCLEYGIHPTLPIYAGGLGGLAGDLLKEASDQALPLVAVGLLYRQGSFRQRLDLSGWQTESWSAVEPHVLPMALVGDESGAPLCVQVPVRGRPVTVQVWRVDVGRVPLYLLDVDRGENSPVDRWIGARLYEGDAETRLAQNVLLAVGGVRVLRALGFEPTVWHLNEGGAALVPLELARERIARGEPWSSALAEARARVVFTTHTPVPAGNPSFARELVEHVAGDVLRDLADGREPLVALGAAGSDGSGFGTTQLALRASRFANAVSQRHGEVARDMWRGLWPERAPGEVPIEHVTNGVHLPTWMAPPMRDLLRRHLGGEFERRADDPATWARVDEIPDAELWQVRCQLRAQLVAQARERSVVDRLGRGESMDYVQAAASAFDADQLTVGFARRVATYKRIHLLTVDVPRGMRALHGPNRLQLLLAGKAHPQDEEAKRAVQWIFRLKRGPQVAGRVIYLEDYDLALSSALTAGCDLWLNLPRPPCEASGTSGMKSMLNGGLQLSVLDGWWVEAYDGTNGWAIESTADGGPLQQDLRDSATLFDLIEKDVGPCFYDRDPAGVPVAWVRRIKASLRTLGPRFCAARMVRDYATRAWQL
jgi:starch phosphorylase